MADITDLVTDPASIAEIRSLSEALEFVQAVKALGKTKAQLITFMNSINCTPAAVSFVGIIWDAVT